MSTTILKASAVHKDILGGRKYSTSYYISHGIREFWEWLQALMNLQLQEASLEFQQVLFGIEMWLYQATGKDFELWGCADAVHEFYERRHTWLEIFQLFDLEFKSEYLDGGSNFRRPAKIKAALQAAGLSINDIHARSLCRKYTMQALALKRL